MIREVLDLKRLRDLPPDDAAALLISRRLDGAENDAAALQAWLSADDAHQRAWARANRVDRAFDAGDNEILQALRDAAVAPLPSPPWRSPRWAAAAAAIVVVLGGLTAYTVQRGSRSAPPSLPVIAQNQPPVGSASVHYATLKGERKDVTLPDGSLMTLDTDTAVDVAFSSGRRALALAKGRAFFAVEHDAARPFVVQANGREVIALGTRFDVRLDPGRLRVVLTEGRVSVGPVNRAGDARLLRAGQTLVEADDGTVTVSAADLAEARNWRRGLMTFHNDTLLAAAEEFNRYSAERLVVRDPRVAKLRVTGAFQAGDAGRFTRTLTLVHPVKVVRTPAGDLEILPAT
jgi:transmembrane sensor